MKKIIIPLLFLILSGFVNAQPIFNLGLKAGVNSSKISFNIEDYTSESIVKAHFGAFARLGVGRIYVQPEAYFSAKGGELDQNVLNTVTAFNYKTLDVPVLLGFKLLKGKTVDLHVVAGPVFSYLTSSSIDENEDFSKEYFADNYMGFQYGVGIDVLFLTLDARMEHGNNKLYSDAGINGKNQTFMLTVGLKIF